MLADTPEHTAEHNAAALLQRHARGRNARRKYKHQRSDAIDATRQMILMDSEDAKEFFDVDKVQSEALMHLEKTVKKLGKGQNHLITEIESLRVEVGPQRLLNAERRAEAAEARASAAEEQCNTLVAEMRRLEYTIDERLLRSERAAEKAATFEAERIKSTVSPYVDGLCRALSNRLDEMDGRLSILESKQSNTEALRKRTEAAASAAAQATLQLEKLGLLEIPRRIAACREGLTREISDASARCRQREDVLQKEVDELREALTAVRAHSARQSNELTKLKLPVDAHESRLQAMEAEQQAQPTRIHEMLQREMTSMATEMLPARRPSTTPASTRAAQGGGFSPRYAGNLFVPSGQSQRPSTAVTTMLGASAREGTAVGLASAWGSTRGCGESSALHGALPTL